MKSVSRGGFSISVPDNFDVSGSASDAQFIGPDQTSYTSVKISDAKNMSLDQVVAQYSKRYGGGASATVGGKSGRRFNYSPRSDISGRIYLTVVNNKVYQVTQTWQKKYASDYESVFNKMISSFSIK
jgi:hypothetical protein